MNKKKIGGFLGALAGLAAVIVATRGGGSKPNPQPPTPSPQPPAVYTLIVHVCEGSCVADRKLAGADISLHDRAVKADGAGNAEFPSTLAGSYEVCAEPSGFARGCVTANVAGDNRNPEVNLELARLVASTVPLSTSGPIFLQGGQPWRWKGVTAFGLLNKFAKGEDIGGFLGDVKGFNILRVFLYVGPGWGANAWDSPSPDVVVAFLQRVAQDGFYVELTLLTDDEPARIDQAKRLVDALKAARPPNVVLEAGNEPTTNKHIDTPALRGTLEASGFLFSSGDYEDSTRFGGSFLTTHTARDGEWPRRAHDLLEFYQGGGPNAPSDPAHRVPIVADEPIRPDQAGFNAADFRAYFGACALLGAGATYHFESGKYGTRPTEDEKRIAAVVLEALDAFPADAPKGPYHRPVEQSLRTYQVGPWMVRVRPATPTYPEGDWTALEPSGGLWKR